MPKPRTPNAQIVRAEIPLRVELAAALDRLADTMACSRGEVIRTALVRCYPAFARAWKDMIAADLYELEPKSAQLLLLDIIERDPQPR